MFRLTLFSGYATFVNVLVNLDETGEAATIATTPHFYPNLGV
jgi:hypothetical protein